MYLSVNVCVCVLWAYRHQDELQISESKHGVPSS